VAKNTSQLPFGGGETTAPNKYPIFTPGTADQEKRPLKAL
jgi:hypothetical protein